MSKDFFDFSKRKNLEENEWQDMPEYENNSLIIPVITATFKFKTEEDFKTFNKLIKKYLYNDEKVFDGMQKKNKKSAWFPRIEKSSDYIYEDEI